MNRKKNLNIAAAGLLTAFLLLITACNVTISDGTIKITLSDYSGKAVNVKSSGTSSSYWKSGTESLEGAVVKIYEYDSSKGTYSSTAAKSTTVNSSGGFTFTSLAPKRYKLTGEKTGWIFVPRYIEITSATAKFPDLMAYRTDEAGQITLIASWKDTGIDVDSILTYGANSNNTPTDWSTTNFNPTGSSRIKISFKATGSTSGIKLDRDIKSATVGAVRTPADIPRVETISIYNSDWLNSGDEIRYYLDSFYDDEENYATNSTGYQSLTGEEGQSKSAYAEVDVMYGSEHYGHWVLPYNTAEDTLKILQINVVDDGSGDLNFNLTSNLSNANSAYGGVKSVEGK